ncbi:hypothetical protein CVT26_007560 [Gymnopilus dilepis]|uniref:NADP-dependent oxidoreductase domain-containing protein n=1 Tax=Gymnopilus dilepis TaxID=231916 RepID=A0A409W845_9AGAR|nr:hypothetical protein CVT26_007560 [Gymnopilus dilepis]
MSEGKKIGYVRLGNSGLKVSKIILGCMSYGTPDWQAWVLQEKESIEHIKVAYEAGINTFDTANAYSNGHSEIVLGKAIKELKLPRDEIVIMTKLFFPVGKTINAAWIADADAQGYVNQHGLSRKHIFESVKHSLERLQLDYIDVLQCHRFDPDTPIEETMQALHDVVKAGYVRYIGMSSCWAWQCTLFHDHTRNFADSVPCSSIRVFPMRKQFQELNASSSHIDYAINNKLTPFISMQNHYNLIYREEEREMFPTLKYFGVGSIPWSPLARGLLTRPFAARTETVRGKTDRYTSGYSNNKGTEEIINAVEKIASKRGLKMAQVALAWIISRDGVTAPIVGTTSLENLKDLIDAVDVQLTEEEKKELESPYLPQAVFGHF